MKLNEMNNEINKIKYKCLFLDINIKKKKRIL